MSKSIFFSPLLASFCILSIGILSAGEKLPKYIFLFIGDGMSTPQRMLAEEFAVKTGKPELSFNHFPYHATTRTASANSLVTDSAASGTAIACGEKTKNGTIGLDATGGKKLESTAEYAKKCGKKVGIVTSVTINHATPASFYAHRPSRSQYYAIGLDLIASNFDYFGGGGFDGNADKKKDPEYKGNLYDLAQKAGYKIVKNTSQLHALKPDGQKILAIGTETALPYTLDTTDSPNDIPTLSDYTRKGIELLDNPQGFFMMIEGGSIDWCGHSNDAGANLTEVLSLDKAVHIALDFAEQHPEETLIIVTGDHETGGMTMGFAGTGYALYMERLAHQKCSVAHFKELYDTAKRANPNFSFENACSMLEKHFGFEFQGNSPMRINKGELDTLKTAFSQNTIPDAARRIICNKAGVAWTSGVHTALPVLTTSKGVGAENFTGFIENTAIASKIKSLIKCEK